MSSPAPGRRARALRPALVVVMLALSAVTAITRSPRARQAALATTVLSIPPLKAMAALPSPRSVSINRSCLAARPGSQTVGVIGWQMLFVSSAILIILLEIIHGWRIGLMRQLVRIIAIAVAYACALFAGHEALRFAPVVDDKGVLVGEVCREDFASLR